MKNPKSTEPFKLIVLNPPSKKQVMQRKKDLIKHLEKVWNFDRSKQ